MDLDTKTVAASHGRAFPMKAGQYVRIINTHGNQVVDTWAVAAGDLGETSSMDHTRSVNSNIFFTKGMSVLSSRRRPMLRMVADSADVRHDTLLCPSAANSTSSSAAPSRIAAAPTIFTRVWLRRALPFPSRPLPSISS